MNIHEDSIDCFLRELRERFKQTWLWPPNIRLRFQSFFKHFLESWSLVLILGWIWLTFSFSSTRSQAATRGLNRSWTLIRLDTSLGVSRNPEAQHVVSQHIYICMLYVWCIYIYTYLCMCLHVCVHFLYYICSACNNVHTWSNIYIYVHILRIYICTVDLYLI